jgi:hypothetical protein
LKSHKKTRGTLIYIGQSVKTQQRVENNDNNNKDDKNNDNDTNDNNKDNGKQQRSTFESS